MNTILGMIQDNTGQISSTRVGKIIMILCWGFNVIMHVLNPSTVPEPSMVLTSAVLGVLGIATAQKAVEGKATSSK